MITTLFTGSGAWNPILWIAVFVSASLLVLWLRNKGSTSYKPDTDQTEPFLSGDIAADPQSLHVSAENVYWGLTRALRNYLEPLQKAHTGMINDYMGWLVVVLAISLIALAAY